MGPPLTGLDALAANFISDNHISMPALFRAVPTLYKELERILREMEMLSRPARVDLTKVGAADGQTRCDLQHTMQPLSVSLILNVEIEVR